MSWEPKNSQPVYMIRVLVFLAVWQRPDITEICFMGINRLKNYSHDRFNINALAVISEEEMIPLCDKYGIDYIFHENLPVGKKKNAGLTEAFNKDWDYLLEIGSDNLLRNEVLDLYEPFMKAMVPLIGLNNLVFANSYTGEGTYFRTGGSFGLGRCMERSMLENATKRIEVEANESFFGSDTLAKGNRGYILIESANDLKRTGVVTITGTPVYHLWDNHLNRCLDNSSYTLLRNSGYEVVTLTGSEPYALDIKSDANIWAYDSSLGVNYDPMEFFKYCSKEEREAFMELSQVAA